MPVSHDIPNDENGQVLRRFLEMGDDLTQPRNIEFEFIFGDRSDALQFTAEVLEDKELAVTIDWYEEAGAWNASVTRYMLPVHGAITAFECRISEVASRFGGRADGWGCFAVKPKSDGLDNS
jgi:hypothetical protein